MSSHSIAAYEVPARVAAYDNDMELMHPNRAKMVAMALDVLPFPRSQPISVIDLGTGSAYFAREILDRFPSARLFAIDGSSSMLELARLRLGPLMSRAEFCVGDFRTFRDLTSGVGDVQVVVSSFALHHLSASEKGQLLRDVANVLGDGGWFVNADIVRTDCDPANRRIEQLRVDGIVARAAGRDPRFRDAAATRQFLDELERTDGDQPQTLAIDLELARQAGLAWVDVFWKEYREVVYGGPKLKT